MGFTRSSFCRLLHALRGLPECVPAEDSGHRGRRIPDCRFQPARMHFLRRLPDSVPAIGTRPRRRCGGVAIQGRCRRCLSAKARCRMPGLRRFLRRARDPLCAAPGQHSIAGHRHGYMHRLWCMRGALPDIGNPYQRLKARPTDRIGSFFTTNQCLLAKLMIQFDRFALIMAGFDHGHSII